jgi:hypothetical protein
MGARARAFADQFRHEVAMPHIVAAFEAIADRRPPAGTRP